MIKGIDHVAIAVSNLDETLTLLENVLGLTVTHRELIEGYDVEVATLKLGQTSIEIVQGTTADSPISRFIKKRGPGTFTLPGLLKVKTQRKPATKARPGVNPFTGEQTVFKAKPARTIVKIQPLKALKDMAI